MVYVPLRVSMSTKRYYTTPSAGGVIVYLPPPVQGQGIGGTNIIYQSKKIIMKEFLVFLCDTTDFSEETGLTIQGYLEADSWDGSEDKAKEFMEHARCNNRVYTLKEFQEAVNQQYQDNLTNSFIFITNNY